MDDETQIDTPVVDAPVEETPVADTPVTDVPAPAEDAPVDVPTDAPDVTKQPPAAALQMNGYLPLDPAIVIN